MNSDQPVRHDRSRLSLQGLRLEDIDDSCVPRQAIRLVADQDLAGLRRLLQPRRNVDCIARCKPLLRAGHHLAGRHSDAPLNPELWEGVSHLERSAKSAQRVVLVQHRHSEYGHNRIPDELLDGAAVILDDRLHPLEIARQDEPQRFGIEPLAERRRTGDITEENRHRLPLLTNQGRRRQRSRARVTETGTVPVLAAARRTNHRLSLRSD